VRLVHLTDTHLFADPDGALKGVNTRQTLARVLERVRADGGAPGAFLLTGDLSQDETAASYRILSDLLAPFGLPAFALAGNHDDPAAMAAAFGPAGGRIRMDRSHALGAWRLVLADTRVPGAVGGALADGEVAALDKALAGHPETPTLLALHHPPLATGSAWMDAIGLANPEAVHALVARHPQVRCVVWGHVHQEQDETRHGVRWLSSPATSIQFLPRADAFTLDPAPPGYRWLDLAPDGTLATGVRRLPPAP
jgi:Icc protein